MNSTDDQERRVVAGRYVLRGLLGKGGMADVELAYDEVLDRQVAVKMLHSKYTSDDSFVERFRREAQAAAALNHPNVVGVYDTGTDHGRPFIVMEYVAGRSLREILKQDVISPTRAAEIAAEAAEALGFAHERGIIHRDIKPGNIMVADNGRVKVTDFGIARAANLESVTQTAAVFGTAAYVAPEQAQGQKVDGRTDLYALGCVLFEMLTGRQPFTGDSPVTLAYKHVSEAPPQPRSLNPEIPVSLEAVVLKAMAKEPNHRYSTGQTFSNDLRRAIAGLSISTNTTSAYEATHVAAAHAQTRIQPGQTSPSPHATPAGDMYATHQHPDLAQGFAGQDSGAGMAGDGGRGMSGGGHMSGQFSMDDRASDGGRPPVAPQEIYQGYQEHYDEQYYEAGYDDDDWEYDNQSSKGRIVAYLLIGAIITALIVGGGVFLYNQYQQTQIATRQVAVPDVVNMAATDAQNMLLNAGLQPALGETVKSETVPEQAVVEINPPAGTMVDRGAEVTMTISKGYKTVTVPRVQGYTRAQAEQMLVEAGFVIGEVTRETSPTIAKGLVIETSPEVGISVDAEKDRTVNIVISSGRETFVMPDVTGMTEAAAKERILNQCTADVPCATIRSIIDQNEFGDGKVIGSNPIKDSTVEIGANVTITLSSTERKRPEAVVTETKPTKKPTAKPQTPVPAKPVAPKPAKPEPSKPKEPSGNLPTAAPPTPAPPVDG